MKPESVSPLTLFFLKVILVSPQSFASHLSISIKNYAKILIRIALNILIQCQGRTGILAISCLLTLECNISFCLFRSFILCQQCFVVLSVKFFTPFIRFVLMLFIFNAVVNDVSNFNFCLLIVFSTNVVDFYTLIL